MKRKVVVLGVKRYKFPDRETGEIRDGCSVHYIDLETVEENDLYGVLPQKASLPYETFEKFKNGTGIYEADLALDFKGKQPTIKLKDFTFFKKIDLQEFKVK